MRSFGATFPSRTHAAWLTTQMQRWGHAPADVDTWAVAARATDSTAYRLAAGGVGEPWQQRSQNSTRTRAGASEGTVASRPGSGRR